jgi:hypothetical protein
MWYTSGFDIFAEGNKKDLYPRRSALQIKVLQTNHRPRPGLGSRIDGHGVSLESG